LNSILQRLELIQKNFPHYVTAKIPLGLILSQARGEDGSCAIGAQAVGSEPLERQQT
jgi:hypothetical protein